jgi:hypothetical protein
MRLLGRLRGESLSDYFACASRVFRTNGDFITRATGSAPCHQLVVLGDLASGNIRRLQRCQRHAKSNRVLAAPGNDHSLISKFRRKRRNQVHIAIGAAHDPGTIFGATARAKHTDILSLEREPHEPTARYGRSIANPTALPPPRQRAAMPRFRLRRCSS